MEIYDLPKATGNRNDAGFTEELLVIDKEHIEDYPSIKTPWAVPGDSLRLVGAITVKDVDTQGFAKWYVTKRTAQLMIALAGQPDSENFDITFKAKRPGVDLGMMEEMLKSREYVIAIRPPGCSSQKYFIIGDCTNGVHIPPGSDVQYDSGLRGATDAYNGWVYTMSYYGTAFGELDAAVDPIPLLPTTP